MLTQVYCNKKLGKLVAIFALAFSVGAWAEELDLLYGHFELQMDYEEPGGWWMGVSYNVSNDFNQLDDIRRLEASETTIVVPPVAEREITPTASFIGTVGEPLWLLTQEFETGNQFLGMRVVAETNVFMSWSELRGYQPRPPGSVGLRLVGVEGTGPDRGGEFALWESDPFGGQIVYFNTNDGVDGQDDLPFLPIGAHSHFNWGFTQPGSYEVEFEVYGRLLNGTDTSMRQVLRFQVPHSGVVSELEGRVCRSDEGRWELAVGDPGAGVVYGEGRVFVEASQESEGGEWSCLFEISGEGWSLPDVAGLPVALAGRGANGDFSGGTRLRLVGHVGPGEVSATASGGAVIFDSSDGFDSGDVVGLGGGAVIGNLSFTQAGVHWLEFVGEGWDGARVVEESGLLRLRAGAGVGADLDYATWAESYERAGNLAPGALADVSGDFEGDGMSNLVEYFQEAAGANPLRGDSVGEIVIEESGTHARFVYLRDRYKDPMDGSFPAMESSASDDLITWEAINLINAGFPLEFFETGHEEGNARSVFIKSALRKRVPDDERGFFRLNAVINANN